MISQTSDTGFDAAGARRQGVLLRQLCITAIVALLLLRLVNIGHMPIFVDEGIHIDRARDVLEGHPARAAFGVGKFLPVYIWAAALELPLHPLIAARLASVLATVVTMLAIYLIGRELAQDRAGLFAVLIYLLAPYTFFYGRMALTDNFSAMFTALLLWWSVRFASGRHRLADLTIMFLLLIAAPLSKLTAGVLLVMPLLAILCFARESQRKRLAADAAFITLLAGLVIALLVLLGFGMAELGSRPPGDLGTNVSQNFPMTLEFFMTFLTPLVVVGFVAAAIWGLRFRPKQTIFLLVAVLLLTGPIVVMASFLFSRHFVPAIVPIALIVGLATDRWLSARPLVLTGAALVAMFWCVIVQVGMVIDPTGVALPEGDRYQYIEGWPSGYGLHELIAEIDRLRAEDAITVYREGRWNVTAEGLEILYPASAQVRYCFIEAFPCAEGRGYLVVNRDEGWGLSERTRAALEEGIRIWSVSRPGGYTAIELWQLDAG